MKTMNICSTLITSAVFLALVACSKQEGPAERAGKAVDNATEKAGQQIEKAGKDIQDTAKGDKK
jgi:PBP1b-binding outer membrane lipoprotein LpoB